MRITQKPVWLRPICKIRVGLGAESGSTREKRHEGHVVQCLSCTDHRPWDLGANAEMVKFLMFGSPGQWTQTSHFRSKHRYLIGYYSVYLRVVMGKVKLIKVSCCPNLVRPYPVI